MSEEDKRVLTSLIDDYLEFPGHGDNALLSSLFHFGSFPEPVLRQDKRSLKRWQRERLDRFFREDVRDLENIRDLSSMELLELEAVS